MTKFLKLGPCLGMQITHVKSVGPALEAIMIQRLPLNLDHVDQIGLLTVQDALPELIPLELEEEDIFRRPSDKARSLDPHRAPWPELAR